MSRKSILVGNPTGLTYCCHKCPNKTIRHDYCYNGKSCFDCPAYNLDDSPDNKPPKDIVNMLNKS